MVPALNGSRTGGFGFGQLPIRSKLLVLVLMPLGVVLPLLAILLSWGSDALDRLLITKVRSDLAVAHGYFERVLGEVGASVLAIAESQALHAALRAPAPEQMALLRRLKARDGLDFLNLRAPDGRLLMTDAGAAGETDPRSPAYAVVNDTKVRSSVEVLDAQQFARLGDVPQERVAVTLVPTRNAAPDTRRREERAMVLVSTQAVRADDGRVLAHVQGGMLLNRNLAFIDHINEIVYPERSLPFGSRGTATLFLDDVRISTNVRLFGTPGDERAIGTRVSQTVRDAVLDRGRPWLDRAFVVDDWYVSGYQPLLNARGERIGMLYVGFLEQPFTWLKRGVLAGVAVLLLSVMAIAALVSMRWAKTIFHPLEQMGETMDRVEAGALDARVGIVGRGDEIGRLAAHLDHLLGVIDTNTAMLRRFNAELDAKVADRTRALELAQQQLVRAEKMVAVGQLTSSIAHEINNPIAVMQGNLDLMRDLLDPRAQASVKNEMRLLDQQIDRMRLIVTQLLQFARPADYAGYIEPVDTARVIDDCLVLVGAQLSTSSVSITRHYGATRQPAINRNELQQVMVNLLVNAMHAMGGAGELRIVTRDRAADLVEIDVIDTGSGLGPELIRELFRPFITRKKDGTGLGLWISRSIVERYGGDLRAADRDDGRSGAVFTVVLRQDATAPGR